MQTQQLKAFVVDDEKDIVDLISEQLKMLGLKVEGTTKPADALTRIQESKPDIVFSDLIMPGLNGIDLLERCKRSMTSLPYWVLITGKADPESLGKAARLGSVDVLLKPFKLEQIRDVVERRRSASADPLFDIMSTVQSISGVQLGKEKYYLAETRLSRRARVLGLASLDAYRDYFQKHRNEEVTELLSHLTTHTTSFFRESQHFDILTNSIFDKLAQSTNTFRIWSVPCSSGEEVYSLAICFLEWRAASKARAHIKCEIFGSDIDAAIVKVAKNGVYNEKLLERVPATTISRYFDKGQGDLSGLYRIKNEVHSMCKFDTVNVLSENIPPGPYDIIFLRNLLIYFNQADVKSCVTRLESRVSPNGYLFLGHSESLSGLDVPWVIAGNSIYQSKRGASQPAGELSPKKLTRVFVIDDSKTIRAVFKSILQPQFGFEIVGEAENPIEAEELMKGLQIDLITLDIHMPKMDGVTYLKTLQGKEHPPIVVVSSINYEEAVDAMSCLELGAVDYIEKPKGAVSTLDADKIRHVLRGLSRTTKPQRKAPTFNSTSSVKKAAEPYQSTGRALVAIGSSTGGVEALRALFGSLPEKTPPIIIAQHIPGGFSQALARRLNEIAKIEVREAKDGDVLVPNLALISPGGMQTTVYELDGKLVVKVTEPPRDQLYKPSVNQMFHSLVPLASRYTLSVAVLTGMGDDGSDELLRLRKAGAHTIAQDEDSSVVYGMPKACVEKGAAAEVVGITSMAYHLLKGLQKRDAA